MPVNQLSLGELLKLLCNFVFDKSYASLCSEFFVYSVIVFRPVFLEVFETTFEGVGFTITKIQTYNS